MVRLIPCILSLVLGATDEGGDSPRRMTSPAGVSSADPATPSESVADTKGQADARSETRIDVPLEREVNSLEGERRALQSLMQTANAPEPAADGMLMTSRELRRQLAEMLRDLDAQNRRPKPASKDKPQAAVVKASGAKPAPSADEIVKKAVDAPRVAAKNMMPMMDGAKPVDPVALGQVLMRMGDYEAAVRAYRGVELSKLRPDDRAGVQCLWATALRNLGRTQEAVPLYREVANSKGDVAFSEYARWQLAMLDWRKGLEAQLEDVRQRRKAIESMLQADGAQNMSPNDVHDDGK